MAFLRYIFILFVNSLLFCTVTTKLLAQSDDYWHALAQFQQKNYRQASAYSYKAVEKNRYNSNLYILWGESLFHQAKIDSAVVLFTQAEHLKPGVATIYLARCYALKDKPDSAMRFLQTHLAGKNKWPMSKIRTDTAFRALKETESWNVLWRKDWYSKYEMKISDACYEISQQRYANAFDVLDHLIATSDNPHEAYALRARVADSLENYRRAMKDFSKAIKMSKHTAAYYAQRARLYSQKENYQKAFEDMNLALKNDPYQLSWYYQRARMAYFSENYQSALEDLAFYCRYMPNDLEAVYLYGLSLYQTVDYFEALKMFNRLLAQKKAARYYVARADTYMKTETYDYANKDYTMALDFGGGGAMLYFNRGLARLALDKKEQACGDFRRAKALGYLPADDYIRQLCDDR